MKLCSGPCKITKSLDEFSKDSQRKDGFRHECKHCHNLSMKQLRSPERRRKYRLKTVYGITVEDYDRMYLEQFGRCKICDKHQQEFTKRLYVDHCHITGKVRGLLCFNCNIAIGKLGDSPDICIKAAKYLKGLDNESVL